MRTKPNYFQHWRITSAAVALLLTGLSTPLLAQQDVRFESCSVDLRVRSKSAVSSMEHSLSMHSSALFMTACVSSSDMRM